MHKVTFNFDSEFKWQKHEKNIPMLIGIQSIKMLSYDINKVRGVELTEVEFLYANEGKLSL